MAAAEPLHTRYLDPAYEVRMGFILTLLRACQCDPELFGLPPGTLPPGTPTPRAVDD